MPKNIALKVCGMFEPQNIIEIAYIKPNYMGFIFYPKSKRYVQDLAPEVLQKIPTEIKKIGVFVNENTEKILSIAQKYALNGIQLHGNENPTTCQQLRKKGFFVWKAISIGQESHDFEQLLPYLPCIDAFLFDTQHPNYGGSGKTFDWNILKNYPFELPVWIGGGIGTENIEQLLHFIAQNTLPIIGIDINSRIENPENHLKIPDKIAFIQAKIQEKRE